MHLPVEHPAPRDHVTRELGEQEQELDALLENLDSPD